MRITAIAAHNFRSIDELSLDTSADGMTVLVGPPGSGKSSIISLVPFVFYGDTGQNGSLTDLRRRGSDQKGRCGGTITFTHGQDTITASRWLTRTMPRGKVKETAHASLTINGDTVEGITPTRLTEEMTRILGMPKDAFRGAAFIGQGEVDTLATATPAKVQELVEHHTGIAVLTKERDKLRHAMRDAVSAANALPGSLDEVERTSEERDAAQVAAEKMQTTANNAHAKSAHTKEQLTAAQKRANELYAKEREARHSRDAVVGAQAVAKEAHSVVEARATELRNSNIDPSTDLSELRSKKDELSNTHTRLVETGTTYSQSRAAVSAAEQEVERARIATKESSSGDLETQRAKSETLRKSAESKITLAGEIVAARGAEVQRLNRALTQLRSADSGEACCPTCRQTVTDLDALIDDFSSQVDAATRDINDAKEDERKAVSERNSAATALDAIDRAEKAAETAAADLTRAQTTKEGAVERSEAAAAHLLSAIRVSGTAVNESTAGEELLAAGRTALTEVTAAIAAIDEKGRAISALQSAQQTAHDADEAVNVAQSAVKGAPAPDDVADANAEATRLQEDFDTDNAEASDAARIASGAELTLSQAVSAAQVEQQKWDAKRSALAESEVAAGVANVVDALRSELLADFTGQISAAASELLSQFGGEHAAFHLDSDFVPRVELVDGTRVETKTLSGGEKARAGLAFRLGIALQITRGGVPDQVIGDEVTNYLDEEGRRAVIAALQEQFPSVLLISHTAEALDLAGTVVSLDREPLGATQLASHGEAAAELPEAS